MAEEEISKKQLERKTASEQKLSQAGVPYIESLPVIENEADCHFQAKKDVLQRVLCLCFQAAKAEGAPADLIEKLVSDYQIKDAFSPLEKAFMANENPPEQDVINALWRYEAAWVLLWTLGFIEKLEYPDKIADVPLLVQTINSRSLEKFISEAQMRSPEELLTESDLIYRYHWAVRDAQLKGQDMPANLEGGVVMERHYALNWLIGYNDAQWDDVDTST